MNTELQSYAGQIMARIIELRHLRAVARGEEQHTELDHLIAFWRLELSLMERDVQGVTAR